MTEGSLKSLNVLKSVYPNEKTKQEVSVLAGVSTNTVTGSVRALVSKGYATERVEEVPPTESGKKAQLVRYVVLTEEGLAYDPIAEESEKLRQRELAKIAKAQKPEE